MTKQQWALLLVLGMLGYGSVWWLFPQYDPSARWKFQLDRTEIISRAQSHAAKFGTDVQGWSTAVRTRRDSVIERFLRENSTNPQETVWLSPVKTTVTFRDPNADRTIALTFAANGQLLSFGRTGFKRNEAEKSVPPDPQVAESALAELLGETRPQFTPGTASEPEKGSRKTIWSLTSTTNRDLKFEAEVLVAGSTLAGLELNSTLPLAYREGLSHTEVAVFALLGGTEFILHALCVLAALLLYFLSLNRREVDHWGMLLFGAIALTMYWGENTITGLLDNLKTGNQIGGITNPTVMRLIPYFLFWLIVGGLTLMLTAFWTAGEAISAKYQTGRLTVFAAFLRGKFWSRPVAEHIGAGLLAGGIIAALAYVMAWVSGTRLIPTEFTTIHDLLTSPFPAIASVAGAIIGGKLYFLVLLFAFLLPVLRANLRTQWLARGLFLLVGLILLSDLSPGASLSIPLKAITSFGVFLVYVWLYHRFDLLAVLAANFGATLSLKAMGLLVQGHPLLHSAGIRGWIVLVVTMVGALVWMRLAPAREIEPRQLLNATEDRAERERLRAEFGVAQRAQTKLLPIAAPPLEGFGIAGLCQPARECGGDLYDFIPLEDGKLGIVVADVSGKGVPAALYMTLTKGLLVSVAETTSDPGAILREVNKHLYEACKRKVFVTLFFGVLDPATKTLTYSRAGHNPPVWRRQSEQLTQFLKPAGIGLGLNAGRSFDRVLAVEQIQLSRNDLLIFYSDGITEAMNEGQEEYGEERLMEVAAITDGMGAEETLSAVFAHVSHFLGKMLPQDDQTLVVVRVT